MDRKEVSVCMGGSGMDRKVVPNFRRVSRSGGQASRVDGKVG